MSARSIVTSALLVVVAFAPAPPVQGQIVKRLKNAAQSAAEAEVIAKITRLTREAVRCAIGDAVCFEDAKAGGKEVIFTGEDGEIITDEEGVPMTDRDAAAESAGVDLAAADARPGSDVWTNYDFVPGENVLFFEDYSRDRVGDFPRRMEFVRGNWDIVEWQGQRLLRNTGPRHSALKIALPRELPERFTIELDVHLTHGNHQLVVATAPPASGNIGGMEGNFFRIGVAHGTGVDTRRSDGVSATNRTEEIGERIMPVRILVDGRYAKVYVAEKRVANVPNAQLVRSAEIWIENVYSGSEENPVYVGSIRIAEGGTDLYDKLAEDGRVTTHGILFAINSATIRPESTPTLKEIGTMLQEHPDLRLRIEGHTDSTGDDASNLELSERRAAAVRTFLAATYGVDEARLEIRGFGASAPIDDNETPEGRQNNRRVELVRLDG